MDQVSYRHLGGFGAQLAGSAAFPGRKWGATILGISLVIPPKLTLISLAPTLITTVLTRNVVTGVGIAFLVFNILAVATAGDTAQITLCLFLTVLAAGTYVTAN